MKLREREITVYVYKYIMGFKHQHKLDLYRSHYQEASIWEMLLNDLEQFLLRPPEGCSILENYASSAF